MQWSILKKSVKVSSKVSSLLDKIHTARESIVYQKSVGGDIKELLKNLAELEKELDNINENLEKCLNCK